MCAQHLAQRYHIIALHVSSCARRDLKCDNIFINGATGVVKIGDLGLATAQQGLSVVGRWQGLRGEEGAAREQQGSRHCN